MEILNNLTKTTTKQTKRVGRGIGSGVGGHTTGRGQKGDKSRGSSKLTFDGTKIKKGWIKRLPFLRGKHRLLAQKLEVIFNLGQIDSWYKENETVDLKSLAKKANLSVEDLGTNVKVLSKGKLTKTLNFKGMKFSETAKAQIISAGGKID